MTVPAPPHPRATFDWLGEAAEATFSAAVKQGRVHHAWLLAGPRGVGKATFAYRVARRLLGAAADPARGRLGADPEDPISRQIVGRAHPDLLVLRRDDEDGRARRQIPVDEARTLGEFFAKTPAMAAWRVAIVDAADDLNDAAANAVLKTLEEPPERGLLLLVSHAPGGLLPTVRSRCRRLRFEPPPAETAIAWLERVAGLDRSAATSLLALSGGTPGGAWRLAGQGVLELDAAAAALLDSLPAPDASAVGKLAESFRGPAGLDRFELFFGRLSARLQERSRAEAAAARVNAAERWAETVGALRELVERTLAVNLDRGDALQVAVGRLKTVAAN